MFLTNIGPVLLDWIMRLATMTDFEEHGKRDSLLVMKLTSKKLQNPGAYGEILFSTIK